MSNIVIVYEGVLSNGVKYQVHQSSSLSRNCDVAINIGGRYVSITTATPNRCGNIEIVPMEIGRMIINGTKKENDKPQEVPDSQTISLLPATQIPQEPPDLLSDVLPTDLPPQDSMEG